MDLSTWILFGAVALLAVNQLVMRLPALYRRDGVFYVLIVVELAAGTAILALGLPGFEAMPGVSWVIGLLFFVHVAQNLSLRTRRLRADRVNAADARQRRADEIRDRLQDGDEAGGDQSDP